MLDGLEAVTWSRLRHAYGRAADVPGWIRGLIDDNPTEREGSLESLTCSSWPTAGQR